MYCRFCGHQIPDDAKYCDSCGSRVDSESAGYAGSTPFSGGAVYDWANEEKKSMQKRILTLGIFSLVVALYASFVGIILSCICRHNIRKYEERFGEATKVVNVSRVLSIGGFYGGIVMTVCAVIYTLYSIATLSIQ